MITNACSGSELTHEEVLEVGKKSASKMQTLITSLVQQIEKEDSKLNKE